MRLLSVFFAIYVCSPFGAFAHCQIPCGIYGDAHEFDSLELDCQTITKAINILQTLDDNTPEGFNQKVRWVNNKDAHANRIAQSMLTYFLAQRIALPHSTQEPVYVKKIALCHQIIVLAMQCKQGVDASKAQSLSHALQTFKALYLGKGAH